MHGIDDTNRPVAQEMTIGGAQVSGAWGSLPIVEVDDIGGKAELRQSLEQTPAKQEKASLLIVLIQTEVDLLVPAKELPIIKQVDGDRRIGKRCLQDRHSSVKPGHG